MATQQITRQRGVMDEIVAAKGNFEKRLPNGMTADRFLAGISSAILKNPSIANCEPTSVLLAAYEAAELGVSLSPSLQLGWLIPYGTKCQFQPSYRAFIQKAYETGALQPGGFVAEVVYEGDKFERQFAPKRNLFHAPSDGPRLKETAIGAYAVVTFIEGSLDWEYLTREQIERRHDKSKVKDSMMWTNFWEEGWRKTAIRILAKRLPMKSEAMEKLVEAIHRDAEKEEAIDAPGTIQLSTDSPIVKEVQPVSTEIPKVTYCVGAELTTVRGQVTPLVKSLRILGGKPNSSGAWTIPASQTDELISCCIRENVMSEEVNLNGEPVLQAVIEEGQLFTDESAPIQQGER